MDFIAWHNDKSRLCHYERECLAMVHGLESHEYRFDMIWYSAEWNTGYQWIPNSQLFQEVITKRSFTNNMSMKGRPRHYDSVVLDVDRCMAQRLTTTRWWAISREKSLPSLDPLFISQSIKQKENWLIDWQHNRNRTPLTPDIIIQPLSRRSDRPSTSISGILVCKLVFWFRREQTGSVAQR